MNKPAANRAATECPDGPNPILVHSGQFVCGAFAILLALIFWTGCNSTNATEELPSEDELKTEKVHLAFAGGGWRAHTGHSAWTMSLLDGGKKKLADVFTNVDAISSNSGGSWFSTMLTYSPTFISEIEATNAIDLWNTSGWLGKF